MNSIDFNHLFFVLLNEKANIPQELLDFNENADLSAPAFLPEADPRFVVNY